MVKKPKARRVRRTETDDQKSTKETPSYDIVSFNKRLAGTGKKTSAPVQLLSDERILSDVTEFISSGFSSVDPALGGGWPVGRASEVFGANASGKSALSHMLLRSAQRQGGFGIYLDFEAALSKKQIVQLGLDPDRLMYSNPDYMEQGWDILKRFLDEIEKKPPEAPVAFVWDSVAAAKTKAEMDRSKAEDRKVSDQARVMAEQCSHDILYKISRCRCHVMFVNQTRSPIGKPVWGLSDHTPCGQALKFIASLRVAVQRVATLPKQGKPKTGYLNVVRTVKNRIFPPHRTGKFLIDFDLGPSPVLTAWEVLRDAKILMSKGGGKFALRKGYEIGGLESFNRKDFVELYGRKKSAAKAIDDYVRGVVESQAFRPEDDDDDDDD